MKNIFKLLTVALFATFAGCVNSDEYGTPDLSGECADLAPTKAVSVLTTPAPPTYPNYAQYTADDIIEAYVVSSDEGGNFYKSISFVSTDAGNPIGFSMPIDNYNLYNDYPPGSKVYINLKNRYYQLDSNAVIVGSLYNNETPTDDTDDEVGRISGVEYRGVITKSCTSVNEDDLVKHLTIAQAKNNANLNQLIEIDNVQFADAWAGKKYFSVDSGGGATNNILTDADGNTVVARVSQYSTFASATIPMNSGKVRGVMTKFGSTYQFMIRTLNDVKLTNPRMVALFEESFDTGFPNWTKFSVTGAQVWTLNTANGNPGNCADMNGYSGGAVANEDWLISPAIDLTGVTAPKLTFQTSRPFNGMNLVVLVSTNYSGSGTPTAATWTTLTLPSGALATSTTWKDSGNVLLTSVAGQSNVRIAFKYVSVSPSSTTAQWRVDNVKVN